MGGQWLRAGNPGLASSSISRRHMSIPRKPISALSKAPASNFQGNIFVQGASSAFLAQKRSYMPMNKASDPRSSTYAMTFPGSSPSATERTASVAYFNRSSQSQKYPFRNAGATANLEMKPDPEGISRADTFIRNPIRKKGIERTV